MWGGAREAQGVGVGEPGGVQGNLGTVRGQGTLEPRGENRTQPVSCHRGPTVGEAWEDTPVVRGPGDSPTAEP